ncbi:MAG: tRNA (guanosine(37)-N1)-methyltransferase TrmD [Streptosporangiaceae bacterium]|nr:tRNA (guanosine(37)-N1)-methyltransferase TrmD [Streptosporangiaceae bacterium]
MRCKVRVDIITIFPEYFGHPALGPASAPAAGPLGVSLIGKAAARGDIEFRVHDLRRWTADVHHTVDDTPFGGGPGMVMKPDVWGSALDEIAAYGPGRDADAEDGDAEGAGSDDAGTEGAGTEGRRARRPVPRLVVPTPSGVLFSQDLAARYAAERHLVFACGRYEGIDARVAADARSRMPVDEVSIGDYVLAGGEAAVAVILEAVCRLLPGVVGNEDSVTDDSFGGGTATGSAGDGAAGGGSVMRGLLEGPVYTRPRSWRGLEVPPVLLSGNHAAIARWRRDQSLRRTAATRPDLIARAAAEPGGLDASDREVLADAGFPVGGENMAH